MKKNFLMVASLLIAAMLLVVSCAQEVKAPESDLVKTTIGLAYGKDVTVDYDDNSSIIYKYDLKPLWSNLENGAPIYGATGDEVFAYTNDKGEALAKSLTDNLDPFSSNYVTPGYWQIDVNGYAGGQKVLTGSTKVYFNKTNDNATVYVSPVSANVEGKLVVNLVMEDLDEEDAGNGSSKVYFTLDENTTTKYYLKKGSAVEGSLNAAHNYNITLEKTETTSGVTSGYHTITIKVEGYENNGGVTKSFLMIPGNDVTISGSIYPSKFINTESSIKVVNLDPVVLSINGTPFNNANVAPVEVETTTYTASMADFSYEGLDGSFTYAWYVDGIKQGTTDNPINEKIATLNTPTAPGDYTVSCVAMLIANDEAGVEHVLYGGELIAGKIRVKATNKTASSSN